MVRKKWGKGVTKQNKIGGSFLFFSCSFSLLFLSFSFVFLCLALVVPAAPVAPVNHTPRVVPVAPTVSVVFVLVLIGAALFVFGLPFFLCLVFLYLVLLLSFSFLTLVSFLILVSFPYPALYLYSEYLALCTFPFLRSLHRSPSLSFLFRFHAFCFFSSWSSGISLYLACISPPDFSVAPLSSTSPHVQFHYRIFGDRYKHRTRDLRTNASLVTFISR